MTIAFFDSEIWSQPSIFGLPLGLVMFCFLMLRMLKTPTDNIQTESEVENKAITPPTQSCLIHVGNLCESVSEDDLTDLFKGVGNVVGVSLFRHSETYAHIEMGSPKETSFAVEILNAQPFMGKELTVTEVKGA